MTNNERKRKHLVKYTRHWKKTIQIKLSDSTLRYIFSDKQALEEFINTTMKLINTKLWEGWLGTQPQLNYGTLVEKAIDKHTEQRKEFPYPWWDDIPKLEYGYGYIKEDKPII